MSFYHFLLFIQAGETVDEEEEEVGSDKSKSEVDEESREVKL